MRNELRLSPVELYFLGKQMNAKYIDYQYIADMPGIQDRYAFHEQEALRSLEERGVLMEDFSGSVEIGEDVRALLNPVFFGETESVVQTRPPHRFHVCEGRVTHTFTDGEGIAVCGAGDADIAGLLAGLGESVLVACANVNKGMRTETFTGLRKKEQMQKAVRFIKGEW